jgi:hypothetical protein
MRTCRTAAQWAAAKTRRPTDVFGPGARAFVHEGMGPWGNVSTTAQSVGVNVFTQR